MKKKINRFRQIKKWGNSFVIVLKKADIEDLNIKENDYFDISEGIIKKNNLTKLNKKNSREINFNGGKK